MTVELKRRGWLIGIALVGFAVAIKAENQPPRVVINSPLETQVVFSTSPERGTAAKSFESKGEIYAYVAFPSFVAKGTVIRSEWFRPDGVSQETYGIKLKGPLYPGQSVRFWLRFKAEGETLLDDVAGGNYAASTPANTAMEGQWSFKVFLNDAENAIKTFTVNNIRANN